MWDISPFLPGPLRSRTKHRVGEGYAHPPLAQRGWLQGMMPWPGGWEDVVSTDPWSGWATAQPRSLNRLFQSDLRKLCQLFKGTAHSKCANTKQMNSWDLLLGAAAFHKGYRESPCHVAWSPAIRTQLLNLGCMDHEGPWRVFSVVCVSEERIPSFRRYIYRRAYSLPKV